MKIVDKLAKDYEKKVISKCRYAEDTEIAFICVDFKAGYQAAIDQLKLMQHCESRSCYEKHGYEFKSMQDFCEHLEREIEDACIP